jgi:sulfite exporter TauE/SafE
LTWRHQETVGWQRSLLRRNKSAKVLKGIGAIMTRSLPVALLWLITLGALLIALGFVLVKSDSWVTIESKDPRVTDEMARTLPVLGREDTGASTALAVADYNGQRVLLLFAS